MSSDSDSDSGKSKRSDADIYNNNNNNDGDRTSTPRPAPKPASPGPRHAGDQITCGDVDVAPAPAPAEAEVETVADHAPGGRLWCPLKPNTWYCRACRRPTQIKRAYSTALMIVWLLCVLPAAPIYYFHCDRQCQTCKGTDLAKTPKAKKPAKPGKHS